MKFLHTADVHLDPAYPARLESLEVICHLARERGCLALLVAGDLFDSAEAAVQLRPRVRELFASFEGEVMVIPGNHDAAAFARGEFYGSNVRVALEATRWEVGGIPVLAIPYAKGRAAAQMLLALVGEIPDGPLLVLAHGGFYSSSWAGLLRQDDEPDEGFFWEQDFAALPDAYVALGHWHNPTLPPQRVGRAQVAYSGTPCPVARGENGARRVFLVEVQDAVIKVEALELPGVLRREAHTFFFVPGYEERTMHQVKDLLTGEPDPLVILDLEAGGWVGEPGESALQSQLVDLVERYREGWGGVNLAVRFTSSGSLSGFVRRCLALMQKMEPPQLSLVEEFQNQPLRGLAEEVLSNTETLYQEALAILLGQLGRS